MNKGDFMADKWEEDVLGVTRYSPAILNFYPFYHKNSQGAFDIGLCADADSLPKGRDIDGDRFTNWEEYRGFHIEGDLDSTEYAQPKNVRLNPHKKNVMIDWRRNEDDEENRLDPEIVANIPGWLDKLRSSVYDTLQIYFIDAHIFEDERLIMQRPVNLNQKGAYFFYYSVPGVSPYPSDFRQNAVTWWKVNDAEKDYFRREMGRNLDGSGYIGYTTFGGPGDYCVPEFHKRCWVYLPEIAKWGFRTYYLNHGWKWNQDYNDLIKNTISHEFGHSVGMNEGNNKHIMNDPAPIYTIQGPYYGKFFYDPYYVRDYSQASRNEISVRHP